MTTKEQIVALARECIGTPYQHQQRVNGLALDCAGVPHHVCKALGIEVQDVAGYSRIPQPDRMRAALDATFTRVRKDQMQIGDAAWIRFRKQPQHLAIVGDYHLGGLSLIHAYNGGGLNRVVEHFLDAIWQSRIVGVWRFPGVEQ